MKASFAAALLLSNLGLAQTPSTPIPSTLFGMHTSGSARWPGTPVGALGKGTCEGWANEEPTRGVFNWSITDGFVAAARDHGVTHFAVPGWLPQWAENPAYATGVCQTQTYCGGFTACRRMPLLADWDAYITARLQRYKSTGVQAGCSSSNPQCHGVIQLWELWNEPNTIYTDISVANVVILTKHEYDIIRSIDPNALIISPSGDSHYMDKYWAAGGERGVDIITFHSYNPVPEQIQTDITAMRAIMAKYGLSSKPLWNTEGSWDPYHPITTDDQAGYPARSYLLQWSLGVQRFYWYQWGNASWGTIEDSYVRRHAGIAYQQTYDWMVGATMNQPCAPTGTVWTCDLTRPGGYQARAVWNTDASVLYVAPSQFTRYRDLTGARFAIINHQVTVGAKPILLEAAAVPTNVTGALAAPRSAQALNEVVSVGYQQFFPRAVAQGQVLTLFVRGLNVPDADASAQPLPTSLSGVKVRISGHFPGAYPTVLPIFKIRSLDFCDGRLGVPCPVTQITVQIPTESVCVPDVVVPQGCSGDFGVTLNVETNGNPGQDFAVRITTTAPHILNYCDTISGTPGGCWSMVTHADGGGVNPYHPAQPGEELSIWMVGLGPTLPGVKTGDPAPLPAPEAIFKPWFVLSYGVQVQATDSGTGILVFVPLERAIIPSFAGLAPNYVGLYQVKIRAPETVPPQARMPAGTISTAQLGLSDGVHILEQVEIYIRQ